MSDDDTDQILRDAFDAEESGDLAAAIRLFRRAARRGSNDARSKLGTIYDEVLTPPNPSKAVYWYRSAVKRGDATCAWNLAMHYAGMGRRRAYLIWLRTAAEMGDADALVEIADNAWWKKHNSGHNSFPASRAKTASPHPATSAKTRPKTSGRRS